MESLRLRSLAAELYSPRLPWSEVTNEETSSSVQILWQRLRALLRAGKNTAASHTLAIATQRFEAIVLPSSVADFIKIFLQPPTLGHQQGGFSGSEMCGARLIVR